MINLLTADQQTVIYYSTNHTQELIYFDSNIENDEKLIVPLRLLQLSAFTQRSPVNSFDCSAVVYMYFLCC